MKNNPNIIKIKEDLDKKGNFSLFKLFQKICELIPEVKENINLKYIENYDDEGADILISNFQSMYKETNLANFITFVRYNDSDLKIAFSDINLKIFENNESNFKSEIIAENGYKLPIDSTEFIGREEELEYLDIMLHRRYKNNVILTGEPGSGKTALINYYASISKYNIWAIELNRIISNTKYRGEFEEKITKILDEAIKNDIVLFIDEIHILLGIGQAEGGMSASNILKPYLTLPNLKIVGATTFDEYKILKRDRALERRFNIIKMNQLQKQAIYKISVELCQNLNIKPFESYEFDTIYTVLDNNMKNRMFPDKMIDFIDFYWAYVNCKKKTQNSIMQILEKFICLGNF